jgi:hypothetical protein
MKTTAIKKAALVLLAVLVVSFQFSFAQEAGFTTIKGKIKDKETKKEVVFASVTVNGTHIGTVTNIDGDFIIKIKDSIQAKELNFVHLGYKSQRIPISQLNSEENIVFLEPTTVNLQEVTIRPEDARKIIELTLSSIPNNYSKDPLNSLGFYRETIKQKKEYLSISEALVDIYKASYIRGYDEDRVKIYKGRKSNNVKKADTLAVKMEGGPYISLMFDVAKNPSVLITIEDLPLYEFTLTNIKSIDDKLNYEISFTPRVLNSDNPVYSGKYYIDVKNLAITSVEFSLDLTDPDKAASMFIKKRPAGLRMTPTSTSYIVNYIEKNGKYYYNYSRSEVSFKCKWQRRFFNSNYAIMAEMAITDWSADNVEKFPYKESLKKNSVFEEEVTAFTDDNFWGEFNTIEPDQNIEVALKKYGKKLMKEKSNNK